MSACDDLAAVIGTAANATLHIQFDITGDRAWFADRMPRDLADAIIAAGWRPPSRTVSTVKELEALPVGTVVSADGDVWQKRRQAGTWMSPGGRRTLVLSLAPFTVIHEGGEPRA